MFALTFGLRRQKNFSGGPDSLPLLETVRFDVKGGKSDTQSKSEVMKAILQNLRTGGYFKSPGLWTDDLKEAFRFSDRKAACDFYLQHYLGDSHTVVELDGDGHVKPLQSTNSPKGE